MNTVLSEAEINVTKLEALFKSAYMTCSITKDGDLKVEESGVKVFIKVDAGNKRITFFSLWGLKAGAFLDTKKLNFINKLNNEYLLVRFCMPKPEILWCDYQLLYEGGITPYQIVNTCRLFAKVCRGAAGDDQENLIE